MNGSFGVFAPQDDKGNTMDLNNNSQEVHLSHYWNVIYKRWKIAVAILAVVMAGTFLASYLSKPLYRSQVEIQIERENPNQLTVDGKSRVIRANYRKLAEGNDPDVPLQDGDTIYLKESFL